MGWRDILAPDAPRKERKYGKEPGQQQRDLSGFSGISGVVGTPATDLREVAVDARRQRVLAMLAAHPEVRYAVLTDSESDTRAVIVVVAIRERATCELHIPRDKYDGTLLLDLIERHGATVH